MRRRSAASICAAVLSAFALSATSAQGQLCDPNGVFDWWDAVQACEVQSTGGAQACWNTYFPEAAGGLTQQEGMLAAGCVMTLLNITAVVACVGLIGDVGNDIIDDWGNKSQYDSCMIVNDGNYRGCVSTAWVNHCTSGENESPGSPENQNTGCEQCQSPIVIDLGSPGVRLTSAREGVDFDLDGDGVRERVAWLVRGTGDGWLGLDRDDSGCIDSGRELFGNNTAQPESRDPNGYLALAVFDQSEWGGNGDGMISSRDAIFDELVVWRDGIHDGLCTPGELQTLRETGVAAIGLTYSQVPLVDEHGNGYFLAGTVLHENDTLRASVDVWLTVLDSAEEISPGYGRAPRWYRHTPDSAALDSDDSVRSPRGRASGSRAGATRR